MVEVLSLTSVFVEIYFNEKSLATASGIIVSHSRKLFLVTNKHVVTGRDAFTDSCISKKGAIPNNLKVWVHKRNLSNYEGVSLGISLYSANCSNPEFDNRCWIEHPRNPKVDVAVVPLKGINDSIYIFDLQLASTPLILPLTMPITLIGYPLGLQSYQKLPFWVTGFIASELEVDEEKFYVNVPGRKGLSGAPVISRQLGGYPDTNGNIFLNGIPRDKFIGIYSGRIHEESDIGCVWKPKILEEILMSC